MGGAVKPIAQIAALPYTAPVDFTKNLVKGKGVGEATGAAFRPAVKAGESLLGGVMKGVAGDSGVPSAANGAPTEMSAGEKAKMEADAKRKEKASLLADTPGRKQTLLTDLTGDSSYPYRLY